MAILSADGTKILNNFDRFTGVPFNATKVTTWVDGTAMDDSKVDNAYYLKVPVGLGGGYAKRDTDGDINPLRFGVKSDGTDITVQLQKALDYGKATKQTVKLPEGTFILNSRLFIETRLIGSGKNKTFLKLKDNSTAILDQELICLNSDYAEIQDLTIDGNRVNGNMGTATSGVVGVYAGEKIGVKVVNVDIINTRSMGLNAQNIPYSELRNIKMLNCGRFDAQITTVFQADRCGVILNSTALPGSTYYCDGLVTVENVSVSGAGMDGFLLSMGTNYIKLNAHNNGLECTVTAPGAAGIYFRSSTYNDLVSFTSCNASFNTGIGIDVGNNAGATGIFKNVQISNCYAWNNAMAGISLAGVDKGLISGNVSWNNGYRVTNYLGGVNYTRYGIIISGGSGNSADGGNYIVTGNICFDNQATKTQTYGIGIGNRSGVNYIVHNNNFLNNINDGVGLIPDGNYNFVKSTSFASFQNNAGATFSTQTFIFGDFISTLTPYIKLNAAGAITIGGVRNGLAGDRITLENISAFTLTISNGTSIKTLDGGSLNIPVGGLVYLENIDGVYWQQVNKLVAKASAAQVTAGTDDNTYLTPLRAKNVYASLTGAYANPSFVASLNVSRIFLGYNNATDADYTTPFAGAAVELPAITANRVLTIPVATGVNAGKFLTIVNLNASAFTWSYTGANVRNNLGVAVTIIPNKTTLTLVSDGTNWHIKTLYRGELKSAASSNTATAAAGVNPTKAEFDALLAELRDLKTKLQAADILA